MSKITHRRQVKKHKKDQNHHQQQCCRRRGTVVYAVTCVWGTSLSVTVNLISCKPLPDGRFSLEVESRRRCRILEIWDQDGYRIAKVDWVQDIYPPEGTTERNNLLDMTQRAVAFAQKWIRKAQERDTMQHRMRLAELLKAEGLKPSTRDPERLSFWLTTLTNPGSSERLSLLRTTDTKERINQGLFCMKADEQRRRLQ